ncbi:hypothetical protein [Hutsoniella sourekii]|uniref:hypothetical protein n=1 Tax=Hutsoniella sourekii TaxID=87650 RepID=UPI00048449BC|nr:hypothetical protein [Hutsoniella sourekii]
MYFKINSTDKTVLRYVQPRKKYTVRSAIEKINELEEIFSGWGTQADIEVNVIEGKSVILHDILTLGYGDGIQYLVYIESKLSRLYQDDEDPSTYNKIKPLIDSIENNFLEEQNDNIHQARISELENNPSRSLNIGGIGARFKEILSKYQAPIAVVIGIIIIAALSLFIFTSLNRSDTNEEQESVESTSVVSNPDLNDLLKERRFSEALDYYPEDYPVIERYIFNLENATIEEIIQYLEEFLARQPYDKGEFDLAYLKNDYPKVVALEHVAEGVERQTQLAVAYAKTGNFVEAERLNQELQLDSINQLIFKEKEKEIVNLLTTNQWVAAMEKQEILNSPVIESFKEPFLELYEQQRVVQEELGKEEIKEEDKKVLEERQTQIESQLKDLVIKLKEAVKE